MEAQSKRVRNLVCDAEIVVEELFMEFISQMRSGEIHLPGVKEGDLEIASDMFSFECEKIQERLDYILEVQKKLKAKINGVENG